jgi:hypothetical protein
LGDRTPVLFDLRQPGQFAEVACEVLRLGNDRQSFCDVTDGQNPRTLLRIVGPPYYSLLRALDRDLSDTPVDSDLPCAFVEQHPRVWVQIGHSHPLGDQIVPPAGQLVLIRATRQWDFVQEIPFQDIYQVVDYELPQTATAWQQRELRQRIKVPLRLTPGGADIAELWVMKEGGPEQLDQLVGTADDQLLARLSFAVAEHEERRTVVLRVRPSRQLPPVLVLDAVSFRPYLKLPNLFAPCGQRLHPPLRRTAVAELLASDKNRITWLYPRETGGFTPESLPDAAFRPLSDWVDYVLDHQHQALSAWMDSFQFDFEPFVCKDDKRSRKAKPDRGPEARSEPPSKPVELRPKPSDTDDSELKPGAPEDESGLAEPPHAFPPAGETDRDAAHKNLFELEQRFLALDSPLDASDRVELWRQMGSGNAALGHYLDSAICWSYCVWDQPNASSVTLKNWLQTAQENTDLKFSGDPLTEVLDDKESLPDRASAVANHLICAAGMDPPPSELLARLPAIGRYLERQESLLPIRTAWLAWHAVFKLSGDDVLALARARDRALERLYQSGLRPEVDLPSFLRGVGLADSHRFRVVLDHIGPLYRLVVDWIEEPVAQPNPRTKEYAGLMFAYAMARLGETTGSQVILHEVQDALQGDPVHRWVSDAFRFRVRQALDTRALRGPVEQALLDQLEQMERLARYKVDRLRQHSRILEPHEKIDPYRNWRRYRDAFTRQVTALADVSDKEQLKKQINKLFREVAKSSESAGREPWLLATALELAPRLGESYANELLDRVLPLLDDGVESSAAQRVLERALFLAAHFDQTDRVQAFMDRIYGLLRTLHVDQASEALEHLLSECFRGLRKLGMRDEIGRLLTRFAGIVRQENSTGDRNGPSSEETGPRAEERRGERLRLLLQVASGWLFFGQREDALGVLDEARQLLLEGSLQRAHQTKLACAYLNALGYAPLELALPRIEELFAAEPGKDGTPAPRLQRVQAPLTTTSHFSLFHLDVVEATVLALVSEDMEIDPERRQWLDEDEFLVRQRIHRDVREALAKAEK